MRRAALVALAVLALAGCAITSRVATADLPDSSWELVDLDGAPPVRDAVPTLNFDEAGGVNGSTGCNTYTGSVTIVDSDLTFGPLATTRMACTDPDANAQESAFLAAMEEVTGYTVDDEGRLVLQGGAPMTFQVAAVAT